MLHLSSPSPGSSPPRVFAEALRGALLGCSTGRAVRLAAARRGHRWTPVDGTGRAVPKTVGLEVALIDWAALSCRFW